MSIYKCHLEPDVYVFETDVLESEGTRVVLADSWLHPGGGGQPADRGAIEHTSGNATITGVDQRDGKAWHVLSSPVSRSSTPTHIFSTRLCLSSSTAHS